MLSTVRATRSRVPPSWSHNQIRFYAKPLAIGGPSGVPSFSRNDQAPAATNETSPSNSNRISIDPKHGLWHFFRKRIIDGEERYETIEPADVASTHSGRPWTAPELRLKSFKDLHTLWYVMVRERNLLATQSAEARRLGAPSRSDQKTFQCRKTMARIKYVLNERRLAYEGAIKLIDKQKADLRKVPEKTPAEINQAKMRRVVKLARSAKHAEENRLSALRSEEEKQIIKEGRQRARRERVQVAHNKRQGSGMKPKERWTNERKRERAMAMVGDRRGATTRPSLGGRSKVKDSRKSRTSSVAKLTTDGVFGTPNRPNVEARA